MRTFIVLMATSTALLAQGNGKLDTREIVRRLTPGDSAGLVRPHRGNHAATAKT